MYVWGLSFEIERDEKLAVRKTGRVISSSCVSHIYVWGHEAVLRNRGNRQNRPFFRFPFDKRNRETKNYRENEKKLKKGQENTNVDASGS